jgi:hypothetical protein
LKDKQGKVVSLEDVYYAPAFTKNIVSLRKLIDNNWNVSVADKTAFVMKFNDQSILRFKRNVSDQLYYLEATRVNSDFGNEVDQLAYSMTDGDNVTLDINIAHGLLGHPDTRTVRSMASKHGWTLTGSVQPCGSCALAKARAKAIPKSTLTKAKVAGERLFLDISGPYSDSLNQNRYWLRIVDDFTRYGWDCFLPAKSGIHVPLGNLLVANKAAGKPCKFLRCDNAGENELYVQQLCAEHDIQIEMTAPNSPQMNGVVERSFVTCKDRAFATMYCARFSLETQGLLWPEAINTITKLSNSLPRRSLTDDPYTLWFGDGTRPNRVLEHLQPFGRILAYVTTRPKIRPKMDPKSIKCIFVGYADDHSGDTYKFYNHVTRKTILSRDVHQWMEWHGRVTATDDVPLFTELSKLQSESVILPSSPVIPILSQSVADDLLDDIDIPANMTPSDDRPVPVPVRVAPPARRNLESSMLPTGAITRARARTMNVRFASDVLSHRSDTTADTEDDADLIAMNASLQSDPQLGVPKNYKELIRLNDKTWIKSLNDELENFLKRDAWEFLPRQNLPPNRKTLRCRWIFKEKVDKTKKSRTVVRGYEQEPGVDYVESFSPLATNTTIKVVLATALEYGEKFNDWKIEMVDVEAAFLNAPVDTDVYIEMPEGLREYFLSKGKDIGDAVIKLKRAQYGLVQSPRLWMQTFSKILRALGLTQCKTDPCLFTLHSATGDLMALVVVYCDDCIVTGRGISVDRIKAGISKSVKISDLGKLKRHLGVDYEFGCDSTGPFIRSSMQDYTQAIVRDFASDMESSIKEFNTPGAAVTPPLRSTDDDEIIDMELFRSYVGRVMFACGKTEPTISNACRELTSHLTAPNEEHWKALMHLIGYLKTGVNQGLKMRPPKDRRVVAFVDSDYASDRNDRKSISGYLVTIGGC